MRFVPWVTEQFYTPLSPEELLQRLQENTAPRLTWFKIFSFKPLKPFLGTVEINSFDIQRVIRYKNSWLPQIKGKIEPHQSNGGSLVLLRHHLHYSVLVFCIIWQAVVGFSVVSSIGNLLTTGKLNQELLSTLGMFAFGLILFTVPFWLEVQQSRPMLIKLLKLEKPFNQAVPVSVLI
ncbi:hypothetical protein [Hymenobacter sp. BT730]|uniref:hypothetical protein n=1 Tax=Hymenobacter sp. BT730 TaxID=3063332 RepID=UPI0026E0DE5E|nr:hypothetical protein [Hymenobacter sp. BT730]